MARHYLGTVVVQLWRLICERCGHVWEVRGDPPERCASCTSRYWDVPRGTRRRGRPRKPPDPNDFS